MSSEHLSEIEKKALIEFRRRLEELFGGALMAVRLFGSKARGDFVEGSDVDVAVVVKGPLDRETVEKIYEVAFGINFAADYAFYLWDRK
ncbi:MAG TPA: nucleotidyltransferase domain-containing protein [Thermosulfidibacter takaii]|uniref:Nucleotidyltransferase domain-containing protein n=1 Tax=Thermosulfidibacter takaii TaxID=412593 RepID=A0A7C0U5I8_9BACT|nr:nucleotidyltransferase domain-containing protein [Thermosulfidibacter takaii]